MATTVGGNGFGKHWDDKLRLLDAIDSMRGPLHASPPAEAPALRDDPDTVAELREKLHVYQQTCAMLEREVQVLEQQTLASLAEAGRLRHELERSRVEQCRGAFADGYIEREQFHRIIKESETERRLLLDALESSESELARMVKTLDLVVRKLQVA